MKEPHRLKKVSAMMATRSSGEGCLHIRENRQLRSGRTVSPLILPV